MTSPELYTFAAVALAVVLIAFVATRRHHVTTCSGLINRLYPHQLRGITDLVEDPGDGRTFWRRSHGVSGLWRRWCNRSVLLQLCQERGAIEPLSDEEMQYVISRALALNRASLSALFFGLLASCMPDIAARKGRNALRLYAEIAWYTHALYSDDGEHLCASNLAAVL